MKVLGIETSCDDTGIAIYDTERGLLADVLFSQIDTHIPYGGVVPELASRDHSGKLIPLVRSVFAKADLPLGDINGIAYTAGPGLGGALLVGAAFAKTLGYAWNIPTLAIHHLEGHLLSPMLEDNAPTFPFLSLVVSGGHTLMVNVEDLGKYTLLGTTIDDAAGEAFDKVAKLLSLPYPGGPALAALAKTGTPNRFSFPRPMLKKPGLDFSFSGLKTAVLTQWNHCLQTETDKADIAHAFQEAVVDTLVSKCQKAIDETQHCRLVVAGGVGANERLREKLQSLDVEVFFPCIRFCTDNGAMIAYAGAQRLSNQQDTSLAIHTYPRWPLNR